MEKTSIAGFPALRTKGAGRPLVMFLHGAFSTHEPFALWMERIGGPCVAVSRRGRLGVGPAQAKGLRFADYLEDTLKVIDALGESPILVGHSLGALIAQKVAELGRARGIALLSPAPAAMLTAQPVALPGYFPLLPRIMTGRPVIPSMGTCARIALNRMPEDQRACAHESLVHESGTVYRQLMFGQIKVDFARVTCPAWVGSGTEDRIISEKLTRFTAEKLGVEPHFYANHAHWLLEEPGWQQVADDLSAWLTATFGQKGQEKNPRTAEARA